MAKQSFFVSHDKAAPEKHDEIIHIENKMEVQNV